MDSYEFIIAARIMANAAKLSATIEAMKAENLSRTLRNESLAYTEQHFLDAIDTCECDHNQVFEIIHRTR